MIISSGAHVIIWSKWYHLGQIAIIWDEILSSGMQYYHLEVKLSSGAYVLSSGANGIIWNKLLSSGMKFYQLG
jgi:hypothetical protein